MLRARGMMRGSVSEKTVPQTTSSPLLMLQQFRYVKSALNKDLNSQNEVSRNLNSLRLYFFYNR